MSKKNVATHLGFHFAFDFFICLAGTFILAVEEIYQNRQNKFQSIPE